MLKLTEATPTSLRVPQSTAVILPLFEDGGLLRYLAQLLSWTVPRRLSAYIFCKCDVEQWAGFQEDMNIL